MSNYINEWFNVIENMKTSNAYKYFWAKSIISISNRKNTNEKNLIIYFDEIAVEFISYCWDLINISKVNIGPLNSKPAIQSIIETQHKELCTELGINLVKYNQALNYLKDNQIKYKSILLNISNILLQDVCWRFLILDKNNVNLYELDKDLKTISISNENIKELKNNSVFLTKRIDELLIIELKKYNPNISIENIKEVFHMHDNDKYEFINNIRVAASLSYIKDASIIEKFKQKFVEGFIEKLDLDLKDEYYCKPSVRQFRNIINFWWVGIFDKPFYKLIYGKRVPGASFGYYLVYLFNEKRDKVYLSLAQSAEDVSKKGNEEKLSIYKKKNQLIRDILFKETSYITNLEGKLTVEKDGLGKDYEYSSFIAKEYDLSRNIENYEFIRDINDFIKHYNVLIDFLKSNKICYIDNYCINLYTQEFKKLDNRINLDEYEKQDDEQKEIHNSKPYEDPNELINQNNRKPKKTSDNLSRYKRDSRIAKTVLANMNYKCEVDENHITFTMVNNNQYSEAHHLIPMKFQSRNETFNLDRTENIVSLCPICHNAIHYGNAQEKATRLLKLLENEERKAFVEENFGINDPFEFIKRFY